MTTYEKTVQIITEQVEKHRTDPPEQLARRCLEAMRKKRIVPHTLRASEELFTRFHAHTRYLGNTTGRGYSYYYNLAVNHAMRMNEWPHKIIPKRVKLDTGDIVEVDVPIPESTTKATTGQLMVAYQVVQEEAQRHGIDLPEE